MKNKLTVWLLCGAPGSGKSTYGKALMNKLPNTERVCPDEFRAKFGTGEDDQSVSKQAFDASFKAEEEYLKEGKSVIIDATNTHRKGRKSFIDIARKYGANVNALVFNVDKQTLITRNKKRGDEGGRNVPEWVIDRMLLNYKCPSVPDEVDDIKFF